jgi:hypothetical protein
MANVRWKDKAAIVVAAGDKIPITDITDSSDKHVTPALLAAHTLGGRTIGDGAAGAIATIDASQTFTNKRINGLALNSAVAITTESEEINLLDGLTSDAADLNKLDGLATTKVELGHVAGVTSPIQTQLNTIASATGSITKKVFTYGVNYTTAGAETTKTITAATILADLAITGYLMSPQSVIATVYANPGAGVYNSMDTGTTIRINTTTSTGVERVSNLGFSGLSAETAYMFIIHYSIVYNPT